VGAKVTGSHEGGFNTFSGTLHLDASKPEASRIEVDIDMGSVWTDSERLTGHLKSGDFFLVEQHPKARFVSTQIAPGGEGGATHTITGNLTLRGVTRTITFPATVTVAADAVRAKAEFSLPRKQFGIAYEGQPDNLIRDEVLMKLDIVAPRTAAANAQ
jgi:polyisoprenoid-binding protein YceI